MNSLSAEGLYVETILASWLNFEIPVESVQTY